MMNTLAKGQLSRRGRANVDTVIPRIPKTILEAGNTEGEDEVIDMSVAENWLIRNEMIEVQKAAVEKRLNPETLSWPKGFWGDPPLLKDLATFFNSYFNPAIPVVDKHISLAPSTAHAVDAILFNIGDPGDGVLCPAPYWNGYDTFCRLRPGMNPVLVKIDTLDNEASFVGSLEQAFVSSKYPIKGLIVSNPHNPLGRCFSKKTLESCLKFCQAKDIHFLSDEIFGPFTFGPIDGEYRRPFTSILSIDLEAIEVDASRVHMLWGPSKVFALAGLRIGCVITQSNNNLRNGLTLASLTTVSSLSVLATRELLRSSRLPGIIKAYQDRSYSSYQVVLRFLEQYKIAYQECNTGPFVLAKLVPQARSWEDESSVIDRLRDAKVWVSTGRSHHLPEEEKGWARITFALQPEKLERGLQRIGMVLKENSET